MAFVGEAMVEIDLCEFWDWVTKTQHPDLGERVYGVPRVNKENQTLEIDVAFSQDCNPSSWAVKSEAEKQWENLK